MAGSEPTSRPEQEAPRRHGRRARALSPEEQALLQEQPATGEQNTSSSPATTRGAVAPPGADTPMPTVRKYGRRARIVEIEAPAPEAGPGLDTVAAPVITPAEQADAPATASSPDTGTDVDTAAGAATSTDADTATSTATGTATSTSTATATIVRDADGVELGEMTVGDAPSPKASPRFEGRVLHRPERSSGSGAVWAVWGLIALAILVLVILLVIGVLGPGADSAQAVGAAAALPSLLPTGEVSLS